MSLRASGLARLASYSQHSFDTTCHTPFHLNNDAGKLSRLMVATRKYKETMTCRLAEGRPDSVFIHRRQRLTTMP
jgi:hypothetical protein